MWGEGGFKPNKTTVELLTGIFSKVEGGGTLIAQIHSRLRSPSPPERRNGANQGRHSLK